MHKPPNEITIANTTYPLVSAKGRSYTTTFPTLYADGRPIISIEHTDGTAEKEAVERAEAAIQSYLASGKCYSIIPDLTFNDQVPTFDLEVIDLHECVVELYGSGTTSHLVVSREHEQKPYLCFCIWDITLQLAVMDTMSSQRHQQRSANSTLDEYHAQLSTMAGDVK